MDQQNTDYIKALQALYGMTNGTNAPGTFTFPPPPAPYPGPSVPAPGTPYSQMSPDQFAKTLAGPPDNSSLASANLLSKLSDAAKSPQDAFVSRLLSPQGNPVLSTSAENLLSQLSGIPSAPVKTKENETAQPLPFTKAPFPPNAPGGQTTPKLPLTEPPAVASPSAAGIKHQTSPDVSRKPSSLEQQIQAQIQKLTQPTEIQKHPWMYLLFLLPGVARGYYSALQNRQNSVNNLYGRLAQLREQNIRSGEDTQRYLMGQGRLGEEAILRAQNAQRLNEQSKYDAARLALLQKDAEARKNGGRGGAAKDIRNSLLETAYRSYLGYVQKASAMQALDPSFAPMDFQSYLNKYDPNMLSVYYRAMGETPPQTAQQNPAQSGAGSSRTSPNDVLTIPLSGASR